jgi:hypothetical protein
MNTTTKWTKVLSLAMLLTLAGSAFAENTTYSTQPFQQTNFTDLNAAIAIGFNGSPSTTDGVDHNPDGTIAYINPLTGSGNISYQQMNLTGTTYTYIQEMTTTVVNGVSTTVPTGNVFRQETVSGTTQWAKIVPGVSMEALTVSQITGGTGNTTTAGIAVSGTHNDNQIIGGVANTMADRSAALDGLVKSVKESATTIIDMSTNNYTMTGQGLGTQSNPAVVYASGKMINGVMTETDLHFSGQENGWGILVVDIDDPNKAQFNMSGQSMWHGLIVVAINKVPTSNKQPLSFVGGGQEIHVIGGVFVYDRNVKRSSTETATLLGVELVKLAGNGNITFSDQTIDMAFKMRPSCMQVRSWRRLQENE